MSSIQVHTRMNSSFTQSPHDEVQLLSFSCACASASVRLQKEEGESRRKDREIVVERHTLGHLQYL